MKSLSKKRIILAMLILFLGCALLYIFYIENIKYDKSLEINWGIDIYKMYETQFYQTENDSVFGDGYRYSILVLNRKNSNAEQANFENYGMRQVEDAPQMSEILDTLKIPSEKYPQNITEIYYKAKDETDYIYVLTDKTKEKLYIMESFV